MPNKAKDRLEILCTIPPSPGYVRVKDLMTDFGVVSVKALLDIIQGTPGLKTFNGKKGEGRCVSIDLPELRGVKTECEAYWSKVHEPAWFKKPPVTLECHSRRANATGGRSKFRRTV